MRASGLAAALAIVLGARAAAAGTIVFDPAPLTGARSSDLPEDGVGANERYQLAGTARNAGSTPATLVVSARADGQDVPGSQRSFSLPPAATTTFTFDYTDAGHASPAEVGLTFSTDLPLAFVAGTFTFTHDPAAPPAVPATPPPATASFGLALLLAGWAVARTRRL
jgi:hypothetical protein